MKLLLDTHAFLWFVRNEPVHAAEISGLARHHGDPFDPLIIAQAIVEQLTIVSADEEFDAFPITRLW